MTSTSHSTPLLPELRPYQKELADRLDEATAEGGPVVCQLPTGAGKTILAAHQLVAHHQRNTAASMVWVTHRDVLADQAAAALAATGLQVVDWRRQPKERGKWQPGAVHLVSAGWRRLPAFPAAQGLLVYDEAHHAVNGRLGARWVSQWKGPVMGLTATPWRLSSKEGFDPPWLHMVEGPTVKELQQENYLATAITRGPSSDFTVNPADLTARAGLDYTTKTASFAVHQLLEQTAAVTYALNELTVWEAERTMWFVPSVSAALSLRELLTEHGCKTETLLGDTPAAERANILDRFVSKVSPHLVSVDVLLEGLDAPACDSVVVLRPTVSLAVHLQMLGRAMRPVEAGVNGGKVLVLDLAGNTANQTRGAVPLGLVDQDRAWSLKPRVKHTGSASLKFNRCELCGTFNGSGSRKCVGCTVPLGRVCRAPVPPTGCRQWRQFQHFAGSSTVCVDCQAAWNEHLLREAKRKALNELRTEHQLRAGAWYHQQVPDARLYDTEDAAALQTAAALGLPKVTDEQIDQAFDEVCGAQRKWKTSAKGNRTCFVPAFNVRLTFVSDGDVLLGYCTDTNVKLFAVNVEQLDRLDSERLERLSGIAKQRRLPDSLAGNHSREPAAGMMVAAALTGWKAVTAAQQQSVDTVAATVEVPR